MYILYFLEYWSSTEVSKVFLWTCPVSLCNWGIRDCQNGKAKLLMASELKLTNFNGFKHALVFPLTEKGESERESGIYPNSQERGKKKHFFLHLLLQLLCPYKNFYRCISTPEEEEANLTDQLGFAQVLTIKNVFTRYIKIRYYREKKNIFVRTDKCFVFKITKIYNRMILNRLKKNKR